MNYPDHIVQDDDLLRPEELRILRGDSTRAKTILGWKPEHTFETMLDEMIDYWRLQPQNTKMKDKQNE